MPWLRKAAQTRPRVCIFEVCLKLKVTICELSREVDDVDGRGWHEDTFCSPELQAQGITGRVVFVCAPLSKQTKYMLDSVICGRR